jgi:hypothetical protein
VQTNGRISVHLFDRLKGACVATALAVLFSPPAGAIEMFSGASRSGHFDDGLFTDVFVRYGGAVHRGGTYVGPRGGVYHRGGTVYRGGAYGHPGYGYRAGYPGYRPGYWGGWARPGWYSWPVGGAIAAGAALGVVTAATAAAWAGPAPGPGLCWYYTDPSRQRGFWDACAQ